MDSKEFNAYLKNVQEETKIIGSIGNSTGLAADISAKLLNTPTYEFESYKDDGKGGVTAIKATPIKDFRDATAAVAAKAIGLDRTETAAMSDKLEFPQSYGASFNAAADATEAAYLSTGRSKVKPQIGKDVARVTLRLEDVPEHTERTKMIQKNPSTGTYESVPTGKEVTTKKHGVVKVKNVVRPWMKTSKDVE